VVSTRHNTEAPLRASAYQEGKFLQARFNMLLYYNKDLFDAAGLPYGRLGGRHHLRSGRSTLTQGGVPTDVRLRLGPFMAFIGMYAKANGGQNVFHEDSSCAYRNPGARGFTGGSTPC